MDKDRRKEENTTKTTAAIERVDDHLVRLITRT